MRDRTEHPLDNSLGNSVGPTADSVCGVGVSDSCVCIWWFGQTLKLGFADKARLHHDRQGALNLNVQILGVSVSRVSL